jgi:hypothetical protein
MIALVVTSVPARALASSQPAIHPIATAPALSAWLQRVPVTRDFPPDFADTLRAGASSFVIETSSARGCMPCADLWAKLGQIHARFGWRVAVIDREAAMLRSGRLGLPCVGDPVVWVRPIGDDNRTIPVAIGTDLLPNLERNIYLATKMLTGVRPDVGIRAMARFTGLVGASAGRPVGR